ncbi:MULTISPECIES: nitroreductase [unclassified Caballeronia]|uniref:nitroreductase n=1 Tax=unclassified Caballeronia TaxID=2646786 RepID=UPI0028603624|nr:MULTISPECIES: nitroreductase [unclassified Caballeronia]MDR5752387.1 nitroreductase [Caballeronia sp. LZ024]MDR5845192.1 nitroreductase [Caballeronia sp. LZ031]
MQAQSVSINAASGVDSLRRLSESRFTCRAYQATPVSNDVIASIVEIAGKSASWCNVQPWHLLIASARTTEAFRKELVEHATIAPGVDSDLPFPEEYRGQYAERRRDAGYALFQALGIERTDRERRAEQSFKNFRMFGAPHVAIVTVPAELGPYAAVDCGAFIGSFLLAAHAHGVATTPQAALARHAKFIRSYFKIPNDRKMVCGIAFGYAKLDDPVNKFRTTRAPVNEVMKFV